MSAPGWFGKLSSLGDFASRRLEPAWVQAADRWLSAGMAEGQRRLGDAWWPAYLAAPVQRFAWAPGVVDAQWWFGVLMPSCDKVGRYFPLLLAQPRVAPPADRVALDHLDLWWTQAARAALQTLDETASLDGFEDTLAALPPWPGARAARPVQPQGRGFALELPPGAHAATLAHGLAAAQLQRQLEGHGLWWPWQPQAAPTSGRCRVLPGLPEPAEFVALMSGV